MFKAFQSKRPVLLLHSDVLPLPAIQAEAETPMLCEKMPWKPPTRESEEKLIWYTRLFFKYSSRALTQILTKQKCSQRAPHPEWGSPRRVSHSIRMVKGVFLLDMRNGESNTSLISNMIIVHSLCVHVSYQNISLKKTLGWWKCSLLG